MQRKTSRTGLILTIIFSILMTLFFSNFCIKSILALEHYNRVRNNPLTVSAVVTKHYKDDSGDDTDYISYISYNVNGVDYNNIKFQNVNSKNDLYMINTKVTVKVSPENPSQLISKLKNSSGALIILTPIVISLICHLFARLILAKRSVNINYTPDYNTLKKDAKLSIYGRFSLYFFLISAIAYAAMYLRYSSAIDEWVLFLSAGCLIFWLWKIINAVKDINNINRDNYNISQDTLIDKSMISDDDGTTYRLTYLSSVNNTQWKKTTTFAYYNKVVIGSKVTSIYLPNRKKPLYHYDTDGFAD